MLIIVRTTGVQTVAMNGNSNTVSLLVDWAQRSWETVYSNRNKRPVRCLAVNTEYFNFVYTFRLFKTLFYVASSSVIASLQPYFKKNWDNQP